MICTKIALPLLLIEELMSGNAKFGWFRLTPILSSASNHKINYDFLTILRIMNLTELSEVFDD